MLRPEERRVTGPRENRSEPKLHEAFPDDFQLREQGLKALARIIANVHLKETKVRRSGDPEDSDGQPL